MKFEGIFIAAITPFNGQKIDYEAMEFNFERWNKTDVSGYLLLGSTGEFVSLNHQEKIELMKFSRSLIPEEKIMLTGVGCHSVFETVQLSNHATNVGADGILIITPHYYNTLITTVMLRRYYLAIAEEVSLPVFLYNIPQFTGVNLSTELVKVLCRHERIVGTKDSTGNLSRIFELVEAEEKINVLVGDVISLVASLQMNADGAILAVANALPQELCGIYRLCFQNQTEKAMRQLTSLVKLTKATVSKFGIPGLKGLMKFMNYKPGDPRMPFSPVNSKQLAEIENAYSLYQSVHATI